MLPAPGEVLPGVRGFFSEHGTVLERLNSVRWSELLHAYGSACDVPGQLRALTSQNKTKREEALAARFGNILHQGTVYEATAYAVPFLVELAADPSTHGRADVVGLICAVAESEDGPRTAHDEVLRNSQVFVELLADREPTVRAGAAYVLGSLQEEACAIAQRIRDAIGRDTDDIARTGMFLGLASLRDSSDENIRWIEQRFASARDDRERFVSAVAFAFSARDATPDAAILELASACHSNAKYSWFEELRWDMAPETLPRAALMAAGRWARRTASDPEGARRNYRRDRCIVVARGRARDRVRSRQPRRNAFDARHSPEGSARRRVGHRDRVGTDQRLQRKHAPILVADDSCRVGGPCPDDSQRTPRKRQPLTLSWSKRWSEIKRPDPGSSARRDREASDLSGCVEHRDCVIR
jgi:hypothetical protein